MSGFDGVMAYLVSPIDETGAVKDAVLERLCDDLIVKGISGLTPLGSTGEFPYLTQAQRERIVEVTVKATGHRVPVIPGVAASTPMEAIDQARKYRKLNVTGILLTLEVYFPLAAE